ncbi:Nn.00g063370.m01.CDS01 [Neocucurbitaria sp. VM-36]
MSSGYPVDHFLENLLREHAGHVYQRESDGGASASLPPSLTNEILPMFTDRWASGPDQYRREIFYKLRPALQLASLLFTENYPLAWFSHPTFGHRFRYSTGTYVMPSHYSSSPEALPRLCEFRHDDWPPILSREGYTRPVIMLNACFQEFFRKYYSMHASYAERYRALFTFAVTLGHEVAHAYEFWLTGSDSEPHWSWGEKHAELGFSWEVSIISRVLNPITGDMGDWGRFHKLCSIRLEEYATEADREHLLRELKGRTSAQFTTRDAAGRHRDWPLLQPREFRGAEWYLSRGSIAIVASIYAVPSQWIIDWFQKDVWFMIIYERNAHGAQIQRPLNPYFEVDAGILRRRAEDKAKAARAAVQVQGLWCRPW